MSGQQDTIVGDIKIIKQVSRNLAVRNEQAHKFFNLIERLMPDSSLEADNFGFNFDCTEYDEAILHACNDPVLTHGEDWSQFFWPAPS